jgi:hypothetical protein
VRFLAYDVPMRWFFRKRISLELLFFIANLARRRRDEVPVGFGSTGVFGGPPVVSHAIGKDDGHLIRPRRILERSALNDPSLLVVIPSDVQFGIN